MIVIYINYISALKSSMCSLTCKNGGVCVTTSQLGDRCTCVQPFYGSRCQSKDSHAHFKVDVDVLHKLHKEYYIFINWYEPNPLGQTTSTEIVRQKYSRDHI